MTLDQKIQLAISTATFLTAVGTFLTVAQMAKQRRTSYRPELFVNGWEFRVIASESGEPDKVSSFLKWNITTKTKINLPEQHAMPPIRSSPPDVLLEGWSAWPSFPLRVVNLGLGPAKNIRFQWAYRFEEFTRLFETIVEKSNIPDKRLAKPFVELHYRGDAKLDFVLPASLNPEPTFVEVPFPYIAAMSQLIYIQARAEGPGYGIGGVSPVPDLQIEVEFEDVAGEKRSERFSAFVDVYYRDVRGFVGTFKVFKY